MCDLTAHLAYYLPVPKNSLVSALTLSDDNRVLASSADLHIKVWNTGVLQDVDMFFDQKMTFEQLLGIINWIDMVDARRCNEFVTEKLCRIMPPCIKDMIEAHAKEIMEKQKPALQQADESTPKKPGMVARIRAFLGRAFVPSVLLCSLCLFTYKLVGMLSIDRFR